MEKRLDLLYSETKHIEEINDAASTAATSYSQWSLSHQCCTHHAVLPCMSRGAAALLPPSCSVSTCNVLSTHRAPHHCVHGCSGCRSHQQPTHSSTGSDELYVFIDTAICTKIQK